MPDLYDNPPSPLGEFLETGALPARRPAPPEDLTRPPRRYRAFPLSLFLLDRLQAEALQNGEAVQDLVQRILIAHVETAR